VEQFDSEDHAHAAMIQVKSVARLDEDVTVQDGKEIRQYSLKTLQPGSGTLSQLEYDKVVIDLVNYMNYMAEPMQLERQRIGIYVLLLLGLLFVFALLLKKAYWQDIH
jgi:ubiquinol-cytochrome c reductase cytochrome c1 subunit